MKNSTVRARGVGSPAGAGHARGPVAQLIAGASACACCFTACWYSASKFTGASMRGGKLPRVTRLSMASRAYGNRCSAYRAQHLAQLRLGNAGNEEDTGLLHLGEERRLVFLRGGDGQRQHHFVVGVVDAVLLGVHLEVHARLPLLANTSCPAASRRKRPSRKCAAAGTAAGSARSSICPLSGVVHCCSVAAPGHFLEQRFEQSPVMQLVHVIEAADVATADPYLRHRVAAGAHLHSARNARSEPTLTSSYSTPSRSSNSRAAMQ